MPKRQPKKSDEIELRPVGWQRFEAAVDAAVGSGPVHNPKAKKRSKVKPAAPAKRRKNA